MEEYLSVGKSIFHKYLGPIIVTKIDSKRLLADTGSRGVLVNQQLV